MIRLERATLKPSPGNLLLCYWLLLVCTQRNLLSLASAGEQSLPTETSSHSPPASSSENTHYGILLDAGSSSTKSKIYRWIPQESGDKLPVVQLMKTTRYKPAFTSFGNNEKNLTAYLVRILSAAKQLVPEDEHSSTPISIMATAGLRFMSGPAVQSLLQLTRSIMSNVSINPFQFSDASGVSLLSGEEEGVYSWIAANYLRGVFNGEKEVTETVGVLEMGGGSTQISFMPNGPLYAEEFHVTVAGKKYNLYVQSYLQFGVNGIKVKVAHHLATLFPGKDTVQNPCMLRDDDGVLKLGENKGRQLTMKGSGNPEECEQILTSVLQPNRGNNCQPKPCAIGSVYQPPVPNITFYATQAFTYAPKNLKAVGTNKILDIDRLREAAFHHCNRTLEEAERDSQLNPRFASDDCMTALYMTVLFTTSYGFPKETRNIKVTSKIGGQFIDWALGAMLMEISSNVSGDKTRYSVTCKPERVATVAYTKDKNFSTPSFSASSTVLTAWGILTCFVLHIDGLLNNLYF
ncbi:ectonucleoside triphosphate diphosphohydrolase 3 [Elysia marginata]|uniref:Ectonucleoside triphosphate diphosphohydrolase 3 n=1 Tax=Elysia marginata TaxID=1093978 RepID=A0AAV4J0S2_9GAST|nr:ectonucleoside triphosphate diphosphohydrolase 3 [Elysia marginata]